MSTLATYKTRSIKLILWRGSLVLIVIFIWVSPSLRSIIILKNLFLGFNWPFLAKWFLGILLLAEIRFTFLVELPLLSCVMSASCPLASSSTWMCVIKVSKDVSFCLCRKVFWNFLQDCGCLSTMPTTTKLSPILRSPTLSFGFSYVCSMYLNLLKIVGAKHNNNGNNTKRNWIILLNIINLKIRNIQHYLDWGVTLAFFKEIQALNFLSFVTGADILWLISPRIQQPKNVEWLEQHLHKMFKPKTSLERTPFYNKNLSIF